MEASVSQQRKTAVVGYCADAFRINLQLISVLLWAVQVVELLLVMLRSDPRAAGSLSSPAASRALRLAVLGVLAPKSCFRKCGEVVGALECCFDQCNGSCHGLAAAAAAGPRSQLFVA